MPDKTLLEIIDKHLPYEIDMVRESYNRLCSLGPTDPNKETPEQQICRHALIESFCVHARALLDFLSDKRTQADDAIARDFASGYSPTFDQTQEPLKSLRKKINKQIFHLTTDRTVLDNEKFVPSRDAPPVLKEIENAVVAFQNHLDPDFKHFKCSTPRVDYILSIPQAAASSSVTSVVSVHISPTKS